MHRENHKWNQRHGMYALGFYCIRCDMDGFQRCNYVHQAFLHNSRAAKPWFVLSHQLHRLRVQPAIRQVSTISLCHLACNLHTASLGFAKFDPLNSSSSYNICTCVLCIHAVVCPHFQCKVELIQDILQEPTHKKHMQTCTSPWQPIPPKWLCFSRSSWRWWW